MTSTPHFLAGAIAFAGLCLTACAQPQTDIVATNTEDTGGYSIQAARDGDALNARVCVTNASRADAIVERLLQQLYSRGYRTIVLDVYDRRGPIKRLVWMGGNRRVEPLAAAAPAGFCGAA